jgi:hypothetical protein
MKNRKEYFKQYYINHKEAYTESYRKRYKPTEREEITNIEGEVWKDIKEFEGKYQVSNKGRIKSFICYKPILLALEANKGGYLQICIGGKHKLVHRLVAEAFVSNPSNKTVVHHKDHNPMNNCAENLIWVERGKHQSMHNLERKTKPVDQIDPVTGEIVHQWKSVKEAVERTGFNQGCISKCCAGKMSLHKGYRWLYVNLS